MPRDSSDDESNKHKKHKHKKHKHKSRNKNTDTGDRHRHHQDNLGDLGTSREHKKYRSHEDKDHEHSMHKIHEKDHEHSKLHRSHEYKDHEHGRHTSHEYKDHEHGGHTSHEYIDHEHDKYGSQEDKNREHYMRRSHEDKRRIGEYGERSSHSSHHFSSGLRQSDGDRYNINDSTSKSSSHSRAGRSYKHNEESEEQRYRPANSKSQDRKNRSSSLESSEEEEEVDFEKHKYELNKIFFKDDDLIRRGTSDYNDFWMFLKKFQSFKKRNASKQSVPKNNPNTNENKLDLPMKYDKRYHLNVSVITRDIQDALKHGTSHKSNYSKKDDSLTAEQVSEFRNILHHYLNFCQKQKFSKLMKIKKDQENLPIFQYKQKIIDTVSKHQVVIVAGDTGCGKSTQVPQYLLEAGYTNIACTQPRRIACISLSKRVGYETLNEYGTEVAYQVRFERSKTRFTRILFLTEGLLLRQMSSDQYLSQYNVIVIDEVHERHIHTDFLLGVVKCLLQHRDDLKLILMSATINIELFSNYFNEAPVLKVPGRLYPIHLEYCPILQEDRESRSERLDPSPYLRIMQRIDHKYPPTERGDLLIFLSGMSDIMSVVEAAKLFAQKTQRWIILPLHSALSVDEQEKVFDYPPEGIRKCIVSTNIAETSVTIDGVRFIVDSGKVKEMNYDPKYKMRKLQEFWISRASAEQRKGRAGRTGPGVCFRLYDESDYNSFQDYATPEIQRVPLDSLILQLISLGLPDARQFPFIESPSETSIENAILFLKEQGALTEDEDLTPIGQMLAQLPVDVVIGKMLIMGSLFHMIDPVLSTAAALSVQSPLTSRMHTDSDALSARKSLESDHGDPFTLLNVFDEWIQVKADANRGTKKWCKRRGLEEQRLYEMSKLKRQFQELLHDHGLVQDTGSSDRADERYMTSAERRQRHGERKQLSQLKREQRQNTRKKKMLKLEHEDFTIASGSDEEANDISSDVKDLEFRLTHNLNALQEKSNRSRSFTLRDINLLKVILCSGLYPQVAIADECNTYKADSEQAFHTKTKPFVLLHPTGVFATQPDLLQLQDIDAERPDPETKDIMSHKHQLLAYVSLLETTKPFLVNTMRVPALQTLLLYSQHLDTNTNCTRVLCDGWLELKFADPDSAEKVISSVIYLRATLQKLLKIKLEDTFLKTDSEKNGNPKARHLEDVLATKLAEFLDSHVLYSIRRVLAAELKHIYLGPMAADDPGNTVIADIFKDSKTESKPHPIKGGFQINEYLTCSCLQDDPDASSYGEYTAYIQKHWTCPKCDTGMIVTVMERLQHESSCEGKMSESDLQTSDSGTKSGMDPLRKSYHCDICQKDFTFTTTEILKHKKTHVG